MPQDSTTETLESLLRASTQFHQAVRQALAGEITIDRENVVLVVDAARAMHSTAQKLEQELAK